MRSFLMPYGTVGRIKRSGNHCETWAVRPDVPRNSRHPPVDIPGGADLKRLVFRLIGFNSISPRSGDLKLEDNRQTDVSAVPKWTSKLIGGGGRRSKDVSSAGANHAVGDLHHLKEDRRQGRDEEGEQQQWREVGQDHGLRPCAISNASKTMR